MALLVAPHIHQWTRDEYYKMAEAGLFDGKHVELIEGQVIEMSPMAPVNWGRRDDLNRPSSGQLCLIKKKRPGLNANSGEIWRDDATVRG